MHTHLFYIFFVFPIQARIQRVTIFPVNGTGRLDLPHPETECVINISARDTFIVNNIKNNECTCKRAIDVLWNAVFDNCIPRSSRSSRVLRRVCHCSVIIGNRLGTV